MSGRSRAPQLSAGTAGPAPVAPTPPPPTEPLPAAAAAAEAGPGCTPGAGTHESGRSFLRVRVRPPAPPAPHRPFRSALGPGLRWEGAGGGRRRRAEEEKESKERTFPGEKPAPAAAASPLPPAPQMRRWRRQLRKETPVLQRHSALLHRPPRAGGDGGGAVAAGSIGAGSPGAEQAAGPASSRRAGMRGRAPRRPITTRRLQGPPRVGLPEPPAVGRPQTAFVTWEAVLLKLRP